MASMQTCTTCKQKYETGFIGMVGQAILPYFANALNVSSLMLDISHCFVLLFVIANISIATIAVTLFAFSPYVLVREDKSHATRRDPRLLVKANDAERRQCLC